MSDKVGAAYAAWLLSNRSLRRAAVLSAIGAVLAYVWRGRLSSLLEAQDHLRRAMR